MKKTQKKDSTEIPMSRREIADTQTRLYLIYPETIARLMGRKKRRRQKK